MVDELLDALHELTARPDSTFRPGQREAIEALAYRRERVLLVQRTGWGKSAVYFVATHLLRKAGSGPTLLISPLLALIRNQIEAANRLGIRTMTVNSASATSVNELASAVANDEVDLLLVSPERLANPEFADKVMPLVGRRPGLMVIDEAHCISDWGHDFRPDYRRLAQVIAGLGTGIPVLACTATANDRVVADVAEQLGEGIRVLRGPLAREGLALQVIDMPSSAERLSWLHTMLPTLPGTGIIYCLTVRDVERVGTWLRLHGHEVLQYTGGTDQDLRLEAEAALQRNEVKALVATTALGMGYDKPDVSFVIHFQAPGSPVGYYQQVGRAGRQLASSTGVLLRGVEDSDIQDWFISTAFPEEHDVDAVLAVFAFAAGPVPEGRILGEVNIKRGDLELVLKHLTVDGVLRRLTGSSYERTLKPWTYPTQRVAGVTADRRREQEQMGEYASTAGCRMAFLAAVLDDPSLGDCGICDNCTGVQLAVDLDEALVAEAQRYIRRGYVVIEPRKMRGGKKVKDELRVEEGRALCMWNDAGWGTLVAKGRREEHFDDRLIRAVVEMVTEWGPSPSPSWITYVPSSRLPGLVADLAQRVADELALPLVPLVERVRNAPPQKHMRNGAHQESNVRDAVRLLGAPVREPVFLVDDLVDSRWTFTEIGVLLREAGSGPVVPLALASMMGRDS
jgi:ATP-dependent DNA helicase RecQ